MFYHREAIFEFSLVPTCFKEHFGKILHMHTFLRGSFKKNFKQFDVTGAKLTFKVLKVINHFNCANERSPYLSSMHTCNNVVTRWLDVIEW